jgi:hypothetical protein
MTQCDLHDTARGTRGAPLATRQLVLLSHVPPACADVCAACFANYAGAPDVFPVPEGMEGGVIRDALDADRAYQAGAVA